MKSDRLCLIIIATITICFSMAITIDRLLILNRLNTICEILDHQINEIIKPSQCCHIICSGCHSCYGLYQSCYSMQEDRIEGYCCDGYKCCYRDEDGDCTSFVINRECAVVCNNQYTPVVLGRYIPNIIDEELNGLNIDGYVYYQHQK